MIIGVNNDGGGGIGPEANAFHLWPLWSEVRGLRR